MDRHCETCTCKPKVLGKHEHYFHDAPSYTIRIRDKLTRVWMCANKNDKYCHERKEEHSNA